MPPIRIFGFSVRAVDKHLFVVGKFDYARVALSDVHEMHVERAFVLSRRDYFGVRLSVVLARIGLFSKTERDVDTVFPDHAHA